MSLITTTLIALAALLCAGAVVYSLHRLSRVLQAESALRRELKESLGFQEFASRNPLSVIRDQIDARSDLAGLGVLLSDAAMALDEKHRRWIFIGLDHPSQAAREAYITKFLPQTDKIEIEPETLSKGRAIFKSYSQVSKQKLFIGKLNGTPSLKGYVIEHPRDEQEVEMRRIVVTMRVAQLSREVFGQGFPVFESFRSADSEYPDILCRWCHRPHRPKGGSKGGCQYCDLPLDLWMGSGSDPGQGF